MKKCKRTIAVLLALALMLGSAFMAIPAQAAEVKTTCGGDCGYSPLVILPGINNPQFYIKDANEEDGVKRDANGDRVMNSMFLLNMDDLVGIVLKDALWPLLKGLLFGIDDGSIGDALYKVIESIFEYQRTDEEGELVHKDDLHVIRYEESFASVRANERDYNFDGENDVEYLYRCLPFQAYTEIVGEDHAYFFMFDICGNPMQNADDLHEYIQMVKRETGHDKVNIAAVSLGGTILTAYVDKYKDKGDIDKIVNAVPLLDGTSLVSDLYSKNLMLYDDKYLYTELLPTLLGKGDDNRLLGNLLSLVLRIMPNKLLVDGILDPALDAALDVMFLHNPQWWGMMRTDDYLDLANELIPVSEFPVLRAKTDAFYQARLNFADNIAYMMDEHGVEMHSVAGYNLRYSDFEPLFTIINSDAYVNGDGMIDIDSTTFGATAAPPGETFPADYKQAVPSAKINPDYPYYSYISPDRNVDLSSALLPETTWIFYNLEHEDAGRNAPFINLCVWLMTTNGANVHTDPDNHPQFGQNAPSKDIWRHYIPEIDKALADYYDEGNTLGLTAEQVTELEAARVVGKKVISASVAVQADVDAAYEVLKAALVNAGLRAPETVQEPTCLEQMESDFLYYMANYFMNVNRLAYEKMGGMGYLEWIVARIRSALPF